MGSMSGAAASLRRGNRVIQDRMPIRVAIEADTGLWSLTAPVWSLSPPVVAGPRVFLPVGGQLAALDRDSGEVLWRGPIHGHDPYTSKPAAVTVTDRHVIVLAVEIPWREPPQARRAQLTVLETGSGSVLHHRPLNSYYDHVSDGRTLVVRHMGRGASGCHLLSGYDVASGRTLWRRPFVMHGRLPTAGPVLVVRGEEREVRAWALRDAAAQVHGFDLRTGRLLWRRDLGDSTLLAPWRPDDMQPTLVFVHSRTDRRLHWLSPATGESVGAQRLRRRLNTPFLRVVDLGETVWFGTWLSHVRRVRPLAAPQRPVRHRLWAGGLALDESFAVADGWLYAVDGAGRLWTGRADRDHGGLPRPLPRWILGYGGSEHHGCLTVAGDHVYARLPGRGFGGRLVALRHGRRLWQRPAPWKRPVPCGRHVLLTDRNSEADILTLVDGETGLGASA
ncbi:PQQ-binding-like beta-propeller repeat protein [Streptomyces sp. NPDC086549]|uniref:outer membrane protein assembly factor BamB family protein n=1 Tax=Streptomyces sp. NPDC086549 TaxID=3365752 RepID=UPI00380A5902